MTYVQYHKLPYCIMVKKLFKPTHKLKKKVIILLEKNSFREPEVRVGIQNSAVLRQ